MRCAALIGLITLVLTSVSCKDAKDRIKHFRTLKDKRGALDYPLGYPPAHPYNLNSFALSNLGGYNLAGFGGGFVLPSSGFNFGPGLNYGSSYSAPALFSPSQSKTGPVTFGHSAPGYSSQLYVTAPMQDLVKYAGQGSQGIQLLLGNPSSPKSFQSHVTSANPETSGTVTGSYVIATPSSDSSYLMSFSSPTSGYSSPATGFSSQASGFSSQASGFSSPVSAYSSPASGYNLPSTSYGTPSSHIGLSSGSSDSSSYSLPISSSLKRYIPVTSSGSAYVKGSYDKASNSAYYNSVGYSNPGSAYSSPTKNYEVPSSNYLSSNYPSPGVEKYLASSSHQSPDTNHASATSSYPKSVSGYFASPSSGYSESGPGYSAQMQGYSANPYSSIAETGASSNLMSQYISYAIEKPIDNASSSNIKYDTISYSSGKKYA